MHQEAEPAAAIELTRETPLRTLVREMLGVVAAVGLLVILVVCAQTGWQQGIRQGPKKGARGPLRTERPTGWDQQDRPAVLG